jgi:GNAT superfamily N-acetyltransferase
MAFKPTQQQLDDTYNQDEALGIPRGTTANQIGVESGWNPNAKSGAGAMGFVQVIPKTLAALEKRLGRDLNPSDWNDALAIHKTVMTENLGHFGNLPDALRGYNSGWDKSKWDNPETNAYVPAITGAAAPAPAADAPAANVAPADPSRPLAEFSTPVHKTSAAHAAGEAGLSTLTKNAMLRAEVAGQEGDANQAAVDTLPLVPQDTPNVDASQEQSAQTLGEHTHQVGWGESIVQAGAWSNLTGSLLSWANQGQVDPNFVIDDPKQKRLMADYPMVYGNDDLRDYVLAAGSDHDWEHRLFAASERADWMTRAGNTGTAKVLATGVIGGLADPAALVLTMGAGNALNAVRAGRAGAAAVAAGRSAEEVRAAMAASRAGLLTNAAEGFGTNAALDSGLRYINDQHQDLAASAQQGMFGAGIAVMGRALSHAFSSDPTLQGGAKAIETRTNETLKNPVEAHEVPPGAGVLTDRVEDAPASPMATKAGEEPAPAPPKYDFTPKTEEAPKAPKAAAVAPEVSEMDVLAEEAGMPFATKDGREFTVRSEDTPEGPALIARDAQGNQVGELQSESHPGTGTAERPASAAWFGVNEGWRGTGVGHALLRAFHDEHNGHVRPNGNTSSDAYRAWKRSFPEIYRDAVKRQSDHTLEFVKSQQPHFETVAEFDAWREEYLRDAFRPTERPFDADVLREAGITHPDAVPATTLHTDELAPMSEELHVPEHSVLTRQSPNDVSHLMVGASVKARLRDLMIDHEDKLVRNLAEHLLGKVKDDLEVHFNPDLPKPGIYFPDSHTISLRHEDNAFTFLHEVSHALTAYKISYGLRHPESAHGKIVSELNDIREMVKTLHEASGTKDTRTEYYTGNVHEFTSGLFSGKTKFTDYLASFDWHGVPLLGKLFDSVRKLLGLSISESSALSKAMGLHEQLTDLPLMTHVERNEGRGELHVLQEEDHEAAPVSGLHRFAQTAAEQKWSQHFAGFKETTTAAAERGRRWYAFRDKFVPEAFKQAFDSVGLKLGLSKSKAVRIAASMLGEDATGINRQHGMSAAIDADRLRRGWTIKASEAYGHLVTKLMTAKERLAEATYANGEAHVRIGRQVAEYRAAARNAKATGTELDVAGFDPQVVALGRSLDAHFGRIWEDSKKAGYEHGISLGSGPSGFVGYMPHNWKWGEIQRLATEDPAKFDALVDNFHGQYEAKLLNPAIDAALEKATKTGEDADLQAVVDGVRQKARAITETYVLKIMQSKESRNLYQDNHIAKITEDLLLHDFRGSKVTNEVVAAVKAKLQDIVSSRERTEFDLLAENNGVRLLDYIDTDIPRMLTSTSAQHAGGIALARKGLGDTMQIESMMNTLRRDGASEEEIRGVEFLVKAVGGNLDAHEAGLAKFLRQMAYTTMMNNVGFNALADVAGVTATSGVSGMLHVMGGSLRRSSDARAQLAKIAELDPGLIAHDPRLMQATPDGNVEQHVFSDGSKLMNFAAKSADMTSTLSGLKAVSKATHQAYVPYLMREVVETILGGKAITADRMYDLGLNPDRMAGIAEQLRTHNAGWKPGDVVDWTHWDQVAADDFVGAIHRGAGQVFQRAHTGEHAKWVTETAIGRSLAQFKSFGWLAGEKQFMRNMFINDANTWASFAVSLPVASLLYRAKLESQMLGMSDGERNKKLRDTFEKDHGIQAFMGTMAMMNNSGMVGDVADVGYTFMFGQTHGTSSAAASLGYLSNLKAAAAGVGHAGKDVLTGHADKALADLNPKAVMRAAPLGNSPILHTLANVAH